MRIEKVLNNNVIVAHDDTGREVVVMGRGLAFGRKTGDSVDPHKIEKTYYIADEGTQNRFRQLVTSIPMSHMMLSERIINHAIIQLGKRLSDSIYVTLPDHISGAITRYREGMILSNPLLWDIRRFYKDEFAIGQLACRLVKEETGIDFRDDEAAYIAMHFVNAQITEKVSDVYKITYIMQEICAIVRQFFEIEEFDEDSLDYYRFITHLKFFAQRVLTDSHYEDDSADLLEAIRLKHPDAYACAAKVAAFMQDKYQYALGSEEHLYLTAHITRLTRGLAGQKAANDE